MHASIGRRAAPARRAAGGVGSLLALAALALAAGACASSQRTYATCTDQSDCASPDACYRLLFTRSDGSAGDGNMCSRACASDTDCPGDGACLGFANDAAMHYLCMATCDETHPCGAGLACTRVDGVSAVERVCLP